jgi:hypothetical protein
MNARILNQITIWEQKRLLKLTASEAAGDDKPGGVPVFTRPPRARQDGLFARVGYVEELVEPRTKPGKKRVSARGSRAGVHDVNFSSRRYFPMQN